jgi:hypothetical protein
MTIRLIALVFGLLALSNFKENPLFDFGPISITGPTRGPDGEVTANMLSFNYNLKAPELVHLLVEGKRIKTVVIEGRGRWRIDVSDGKLKIFENGVILELPIDKEGILASHASTNESNQFVIDISVDSNKVIKIECPNQIMGQPTVTRKPEQAVTSDGNKPSN